MLYFALFCIWNTRLESRLLICSGGFHGLSNRLGLEVRFGFEGGGSLLVIPAEQPILD